MWTSGQLCNLWSSSSLPLVPWFFDSVPPTHKLPSPQKTVYTSTTISLLLAADQLLSPYNLFPKTDFPLFLFNTSAVSCPRLFLSSSNHNFHPGPNLLSSYQRIGPTVVTKFAVIYTCSFFEIIHWIFFRSRLRAWILISLSLQRSMMDELVPIYPRESRSSRAA